MTAHAPPRDTRTRLVETAALLFRDRGYHGAGLAELLDIAGASKSSLFHHFPAGKEDLALAAARWADAGTLKIIDDSFAGAPDFAGGARTFCHKLAKFMEIEEGWHGCPVSQILFRGPDDEIFRAESARIFDGWRDRVAAHGARLGLTPNLAAERSEMLLIAVHGAWVIARARRDADVLRHLTDRLAL